jgi:hypothetical protein
LIDYRKEKQMKLLSRIILVPTFLSVAFCAYGQDVHYNYDHSANFAAYKTYQWVDIPGGGVPDQLIDQSIKRAIDEQLALKGLTKVEKDADLHVVYRVGINLEKSIDLHRTGGPGFAGPWGFDSVHGQTSTVPVGMLLVDIYDQGKKQLIWRGDATKTIDLKKDPDKNYKNLQKAMAKLFKNYPPQPRK